jgi:putative FmdB family regulatory protein
MLQRSIRRLVKLPLYEYECPKDGLFERIQKFSDPPLDACPTCGGPIEKLLSAPAIQFKGSGWYITDYARKSTGGEAAGKKDGSDTGGAKGASKDSSPSSASSESKSSTSETKSGSTETKSSSSGSSDKK